MTHENSRREEESRKLDALISIGKAVTELGASLTAMIRYTLDNGQKLDSMDRKLDKLLTLAERSESTTKA